MRPLRGIVLGYEAIRHPNGYYINRVFLFFVAFEWRTKQ